MLAAGTGARIALLNSAARDEIEAVVRRIEKIETAVEPTVAMSACGEVAAPVIEFRIQRAAPQPLRVPDAVPHLPTC